jgi:bacterioferritin (cytochrome b1)
MIKPISRRSLLVKGATLSAAGMAVLAGTGTAGFGRAALAQNASKDTDTLNVALGLEHQAIGAYQVGADSGLLKQPALNIALLFQSHHKAHRDALIAAIQKLGGTPAAAQTTGDYAKSLNAASLKTQNDVLELALKLELGAVNAYISVIPVFQDRDLAKLSGRLIADEAMHWTALLSTLGQPLPAQALTFGA